MPKIKYIEHNGKEHEADVPEGWSVMEGAVKNNIPGIDADCGGACACATCHVYVEPEWFDAVGPAGGDEAEMLELAGPCGGTGEGQARIAELFRDLEACEAAIARLWSEDLAR